MRVMVVKLESKEASSCSAIKAVLFVLFSILHVDSSDKLTNSTAMSLSGNHYLFTKDDPQTFL